MNLDATNDSEVRNFEQYVRGEMGTNATETEPPSYEDIERPTRCAYCGRLVRLAVGDGGYWVVCVHCLRRGPLAKGKWFAIILWNGGVRAPALASRNAAERIVDYYFESTAAPDRRIVTDKVAAIILQYLAAGQRARN